MATFTTRRGWRLGVLLAVLWLGGPAGAATTDIDNKLKEPATMAAFATYNREHAQQIQHALGLIYVNNSAFQRDADLQEKPLNDSIVGPITRKWMARFCEAQGILASDPEFVPRLLAELERQAANAKAPPPAVPAAPAASAPPAATELGISYWLDPAAIGVQEAKLKFLALLQKRVFGTYQSQREFEDAMMAAVGSGDVDKDFLAVIAQNAKGSAYQLDTNAQARLAQPLSTRLLAQLNQFNADAVYTDDKEFAKALHKVVADAELAKELDSRLPLIENAARRASYRVTEEAMALLSEAKVPAVVAGMLQELTNIEYPTESLLLAAVRWKLRVAVGMCRGNMSAHNQDPMEEDKFKELKPVLAADATLYPDIAKLRPQATACGQAQLAQAKDLDDRLGNIVIALLRTQMKFAKVNPKPQPGALTDWSVNSCSCLRNTLAGQVYGFYPYWLKGREHAIDFGQLSHIGFYGLSFDENGALTESPGEADWPADLLQAAQKYNTKVDWVIHRSDWREWRTRTPQQKQARLDRLVDSIAAVLGKPVDGTMSWITPVVSLGSAQRPTHGDGVTIFFDDLPEEDAPVFQRFILKLAARLTILKGERSLNIMTTHAAMKKPGAFAYEQLSKLIDDANHFDENASFAEQKKSKALDVHVLVLIEEPTADSKKALREEIEKSLRGIHRMRLLRDVIPVVVYDNASWEQLDDDIIYFKDNFEGIGFWPLPLAALEGRAPAGKSVDALLKRRYQVADASPRIDALCGVVCPNRVAFRIGFWTLLLAASGVTIWIFGWCCACRAALSQGYWVQGGLGVLWLSVLAVAFAILACDPILKSFDDSYGPLLLVSVAFVAVFGWYVIYKHRQQDKP